MKISIVTPSLNQAKFLRQAVNSVISQRGNFQLEYIVIDGGSKDGSIDILKQIEHKLKSKKNIDFFWKSELDKGQGNGTNKGLKLTTGDIIGVLNSDDIYHQNTLSKIATVFRENEKTKWLCGYCRIVDTENNEIQKIITKYKNFWLNRYSYKKLLITNFICQPAVFWRRTIHNEIGFLNDKLKFTMDYDFWLRIGKKYNPIIFREYLASFRLHQTSKSKTQFIHQFNEDLSTAKKYTNDKKIFFLHKISDGLIKCIYRIIK